MIAKSARPYVGVVGLYLESAGDLTHRMGTGADITNRYHRHVGRSVLLTNQRGDSSSHEIPVTAMPAYQRLTKTRTCS
jgi:hypothetical protein